MEQSDLIATLKRVVKSLEQAGVAYHLTGGVVSSYYGEPRLTQDIDVVVAATSSDVNALFTALDSEFLVDRLALEEAVTNLGLFQALDNETFIKVDFHLLGTIQAELQRSVKIELFADLTVPVASKCDAILSKLVWIREGSEKSRTDVLGMLRDPESFDEGLLNELAAEHGVADILAQIRSELAEN